MTEAEARAKLAEALKHLDLINLGTVFASLAEGNDWYKYDNSKWKPNFNRALSDKDWLANHAGEIKEALETLYNSRPKRS